MGLAGDLHVSIRLMPRRRKSRRFLVRRKGLQANKCVNRDAAKFRVMAGPRALDPGAGHDTREYDAAAVDSVVSPQP